MIHLTVPYLNDPLLRVLPLHGYEVTHVASIPGAHRFLAAARTPRKILDDVPYTEVTSLADYRKTVELVRLG